MASTDEMIQQLLMRQGNISPDDAMRMRNFYSANPEQLERKYMNMPAANYEGNAGMDFSKALDKLVLQTERSTVPQAQSAPASVEQTVARDTTPQGRVTVGQPQVVGKAKEDLSAVTPPVENPAWNKTPVPKTSGYEVDPQTSSQGQDLSLPGWLLAALGVARSAFPGATSATTPQLAGPNPNQKQIGYEPKLTDQSNQAPKQLEYQPKLEDKTTRGNFESTGKEIDTVNNRNQAQKTGKKAVLQAEIDAENQSAAALQEQIRRQMMNQQAAEELSRSARRAVGRR